MTILAVVDTETTGITGEVGVVELASAVLTITTEAGLTEPSWHSTLVSPGLPIPPEASAVHHLTDEDVRDAPTLHEATRICHLADVDVLVAHNATYDSARLPLLRQPWICTWKVALQLWPDASQHSLQYLRYHLGLRPLFPEEAGSTPHRALYDVVCTLELLRVMLRRMSLDDMVALSSRPALLPRMRFGKWKGTPFGDVPHDYLSWLLRQDSTHEDPDLLHTIRFHMRGRR